MLRHHPVFGIKTALFRLDIDYFLILLAGTELLVVAFFWNIRPGGEIIGRLYYFFNEF